MILDNYKKLCIILTIHKYLNLRLIIIASLNLNMMLVKINISWEDPYLVKNGKLGIKEKKED